MAKGNFPLFAFNRGLISTKALARTDLKRTALSAEIQTNWMPRTLGSMMLRPGLGHLGRTPSDGSSQAYYVPFIFSTSDTAILEFTSGTLRPLVDEQPIDRASVGTAVTNGTFHTDIAGWTDDDESGATSQWLTDTVVYGYMSLVGTGFNAARRKQTVTVAAGDIGVEHALSIRVGHPYPSVAAPAGKVTIRVGSSDGSDDYIRETELGIGTHSLAFTPSGDIYIEVSNRAEYEAALAGITIETTTDGVGLATSYATGDIPKVRFDQSGDVVFLACPGYKPAKVERRGTRSWSAVEYAPEDGPFRAANTGTTTLEPSALTGDITLTASKPLFRSTHVGALFKITSVGQNISTDLTADGQYTDPIRVTGVGSARTFNLAIPGVWTATVTLQRSVGEVGSWIDISNYTSDPSTTYNDALDNQIVYYRFGIKTGNYTSGTATAQLAYSTGSLTGIARVTGYTSSTVVNAAVLKPLGAVTATADWAEGAWSSYRGYPSAVVLSDGRIWWAGKDKVWGSVSDAFDSFDSGVEGDSGPISRSIGSGPVDTINWLLSLQRLIAGGQGAEHSIRSSSIDEPVTPTNFNIKSPSTRGSTEVAAVKVDTEGLFVRRNKLFQLSQADSYADYTSQELTLLCPEVGGTGFTRVAVQRSPDTRIHCVREDGGVGILVYDRAEEVKCWVEFDMDDAYYVVDAFVLPDPDSNEDKVYYAVKYAPADTVPVYFLTRWAHEDECSGGTLNKQADLFTVYEGAPKQVFNISADGLGHFGNNPIVVWADGRDLGTITPSGGNYTLPVTVTNAILGLPYTARFKSTKLAYAAMAGTALTQRKRIDHVGLILEDTHYQGLRYGPDFEHLDDLPLVENGARTAADTVWESYDEDSVEFNGEYDTDSRLCLEASSPRPCTVLAAVIDLQVHEKV